jgi:hypothetical protein
MNISDESKWLGNSELLKNDVLQGKRKVLHTSITVYVEIRLINLIKMLP